MTNRWICARCFTSSEEGVATCPNCGLERGAVPESAAGEVGNSGEVGTSSGEVESSSGKAGTLAEVPVAAAAVTPTDPTGQAVTDPSMATGERWVCHRCFASNDGWRTTCPTCGLARGAEPVVGEASFPGAASPTAPEAGGGSRFPWRWVIYGAIALAVAGGSVLFAAQRDDSGEISDAGDLSVFDLQVGDCFDVSTDATEVETVRAVPCDEPHIYELFWTGTYPSDVEPAVAEYEAWVEDQCDPAFAAYVGITYDESIYYMGYLSPTSEGWAGGDHEYSCYLFNESETAMAGSARGAAE